MNVSLSIAKFDRFEDLEDHVMDYFVSVTDLKVLSMGLNSPRKSVGRVSAQAECNGANQRGFAPPTRL